MQLTWIVEKVREWTDPAKELPEDAVDIDHLLTLVSVYWFGKGGAGAANLLYEAAHAEASWGQTHDRPQGFVSFARSRWSAASSIRTTSARTGTSTPRAAISPPWSSRTCSSMTCGRSSRRSAESDPGNDLWPSDAIDREAPFRRALSRSEEGRMRAHDPGSGPARHGARRDPRLGRSRLRNDQQRDHDHPIVQGNFGTSTSRRLREHKVDIDTKGDSTCTSCRTSSPPAVHRLAYPSGPEPDHRQERHDHRLPGRRPDLRPDRVHRRPGLRRPGNGRVRLLRDEGAVPAEAIAVQLVVDGGTRRIDTPAPGNCPF